MASSSTTNGQPQPGQGWTNGDLAPQLFPYSQDGKLELYGRQRRWIGLAQGWTRISEGTTELDARHSGSQTGASVIQNEQQEAQTVRSLIAQLCETFYRQGWATGTGGGLSIRVGGPSEHRPWRVFVAPSGVQKEDMIGDDIFELDMDRNVVVPPTTPHLRQSACTPLWYVVYRHRPQVTCVIHTHSLNAQLATLIDEESDCLELTHLEMLKGVGNHAYDDVLRVPIIDNRPTEDLLAEQLETAILNYPQTNAVLVRRHGLYAWGDSWEQAKTQCESFDYLFDTALRMHQLGLSAAAKPTTGTYREEEEPSSKRLKTTGFHGLAAVDNAADLQSNAVPLLPRDSKILLLDIEGCTTSISFVKDVLFPYVRTHLEAYLEAHVTDPATYSQLCADLSLEVEAAGGSTVDRDNAIALVTYLMDRDVKSATLKSLQGDLWKAGYHSGELQGHVYNDFVPLCQWMKDHEVPIYIYSSGSVAAQKLLFGHSTAGDLLPFLAGHFDITTSGNKKETSSYQAIAQSLNVDPAEIVFVSDAEAELEAANKAGVQAIMSIRPGNAPLTAAGKKKWPAVHSLLQLCGE